MLLLSVESLAKVRAYAVKFCIIVSEWFSLAIIMQNTQDLRSSSHIH